MTVSLEAVTLDDNLRLDGVHTTSKVAMSIRPTFGAPVAQRCARSAGDNLYLIASQNGNDVIGLFTAAQLESIAALRDLGEPVTLVHHLLTYNVIIPPTALDALTMVDDIADPCGDEWYTGTIPLITV